MTLVKAPKEVNEVALSKEFVLDKRVCSRKVNIDMNAWGSVLKMDIEGGCGGQNELISELYTRGWAPAWYHDIKCGSKDTSCVAEISKLVEKMQEGLL